MTRWTLQSFTLLTAWENDQAIIKQWSIPAMTVGITLWFSLQAVSPSAAGLGLPNFKSITIRPRSRSTYYRCHFDWTGGKRWQVPGSKSNPKPQNQSNWKCLKILKSLTNLQGKNGFTWIYCNSNFDTAKRSTNLGWEIRMDRWPGDPWVGRPSWSASIIWAGSHSSVLTLNVAGNPSHPSRPDHGPCPVDDLWIYIIAERCRKCSKCPLIQWFGMSQW